MHFIEASATLDEAKTRVRELDDVWPGDHVIDNEETGERLFVSTTDERKK